MKQTIKSTFVIALTSVLFFSCSKADEIVENLNNEDKLVKVSIIAGNPDVVAGTKTEIKGGTTPFWSVGDEIGVTDATAFTNEAGKTSCRQHKFSSSLTEASETAVFTGSTTLNPTLYAYYPYNSTDFYIDKDDNNKVYAKAYIHQNQYPTQISFEGSSDVLVSEPFSVGEETTQVENLIFKRLNAVVKVVLKDKSTDERFMGKKPSFVALEASDIATGLVGRVRVNFVGQSLGDIYQDASKKVVAFYTEATQYEINNSNATYLCVYPQTLASGTTLKVTANIGDYNIERNITLPNDINLLAGKITTLNISIREGDIKESTTEFALFTGDITEGDYIVYYDGKAMKAAVSSNRLSYDEVTPANDVISDPDASIVWHIAPSGSYYTIYNESEGKYAASNGTKNQAKLLTSGTDNMSLWSVTKTNDAFEFVNKHNASININSNLRNNGTYGFACYSASTGGALSLYKSTKTDERFDPELYFDVETIDIVKGEDYTPAHLSNTNNLTVTYSSSEETVATVNNLGELTIIDAGTSTITAKFLGNETFKPGSASYTINVTVPAVPDFTTVAELNAKTATSNGSYSGTLTNAVISFVPDDKNAVIKDGTGSILVFIDHHNLIQGQTLTGNITVTTKMFHETAEITNLEANFTGSGAVVDPQVFTLSQLVGNLSTYQNAYAKVSDLTITAISGQNIIVKNGSTQYYVYASAGVPSSLEVGDIITAIGTIAHYGDNDQIRVWNDNGFVETGHIVIPTHTVTYTQPSHGSFTVSVDGNSINSGTAVQEGTVVTLTATETTGYHFSSWTVNGATVSGNTPIATFTVGSSDVNVSASFVENSTTQTASYDFSKIPGFAEWTTSYTKHDVSYSESDVTFVSANRQTSTITDIPVTKGNEVYLVLKSTVGSSISRAKFVCRQWGTKAQTITLYYSTNGGSTYSTTGVTSNNFTISTNNLPEGTNAVKITFSSNSNQVGIASAEIDYVPVQ